MKKIYVITKGEYSDYHICAVYSDKKKAEEVAKLFKKSWIEEWPIDVVPSQNKKRFWISMRKSGEIKKIKEDNEFDDVFDFRDDATEWIDKEGWTFQVWAKDKDHAIKIAGEWRRKLLLGEK